ncbi:MAG TPA: CDP-alcohol phosphatidyltransferase family protein [Bradyrhizobium sp.]|uniref:CDP-alcohol phosphatidyltransferase family protein n=1 Tax=Bradyrhizobium sp. TaxID=376 RepID=UPI002D12D942|nr:CDP-alcohol phosphatidyltransferase family protein [Bradyrhizobium sp.]HLZ03967.1 CDP-alcohol phosphatidyltransferase family protein [Bradyrhizobium sp.]
METAEPVRRTLEIEEVTNLYFIHPIASRLTPLFAALRIPPNAVSVAGMVFGILAGVAYHHYQDPRNVIAAFVLMIAWHVMDGADGQLARLTNAQSATGKVLDGICDYVTFIAVYSGLALSLSGQYGGEAWILVIAAGLCHILQSAAYEVQRQEYNFWGLGRKSAEFVALTVPRRAIAAGPPMQRLADFVHRAYVRIQFLAAGVTVEFHQRLTVALTAHPDRDAAIREQYRRTFAPLVRQWSVMSANYRTLGIFVFALAGAPQYYFWLEIVGGSVISVALLRKRQARYRSFFEGLGMADEPPVALSMRTAE